MTYNKCNSWGLGAGLLFFIGGLILGVDILQSLVSGCSFGDRYALSFLLVVFTLVVSGCMKSLITETLWFCVGILKRQEGPPWSI